MTIDTLVGLPGFLVYFGVGIVLLMLFSLIYTSITPQRELALIRKGNVAAAIGFGGALLGYTVPLASAISHSMTLGNMMMWGIIGLVVQLIVLGVVRLAVPAIFDDIKGGKVASATLSATISLTVGVINAASMTY